MGNTAAALPLYEEEVRMSRQMLGAEHPDTLVAQDNFGLARCDAAVEALDVDALEEGLGLLRQAVAGMRKVLGEGRPHTQMAIRELEHFEQQQDHHQQHEEEEEQEEETMCDRMRKRRRFR